MSGPAPLPQPPQPPLQDLGAYRLPEHWQPGAPLWCRALWLLLGEPLLAGPLPGTPWRRALLRAFGARLGRGGRIKPRLRVKFPWRLEVGDHCWLGEEVWIDNLAPVRLGHRVCLSQGAYLCTGNHDFRSPAFSLRPGPIRIDDDAWVAARAVLAPGTHVGRGTVVGLGAVASGSLPAGAVLRGNPAVAVGRREGSAAAALPPPLAPPLPPLLLVVPTLNSWPLLGRLVASLQAQSHQGWRVLLVDGPSGEEHRAWLADLCGRDPRFQVVAQEPDRPGIFGAMDQGFAAAGPDDWLLFWGSDDWAAADTVLASALTAIAAATAAGEPPDLLVCAGRYASAAGPAGDATAEPVLGRRTAFRWRGSYRLSLFLGSTPPHQATLIGPGARRRLAGHAPGFQLSADLDYFLQLSRWPDLRVQLLPLELVHMAEGGVSARQTERRLGEVRRAYRRAFGGFWGAAFLLRYAQRIWSALVP